MLLSFDVEETFVKLRKLLFVLLLFMNATGYTYLFIDGLIRVIIMELWNCRFCLLWFLE